MPTLLSWWNFLKIRQLGEILAELGKLRTVEEPTALDIPQRRSTGVFTSSCPLIRFALAHGPRSEFEAKLNKCSVASKTFLETCMQMKTSQVEQTFQDQGLDE